MNIKEEMISHLKELLKMEGEAESMYMEMVKSLETPALKSFFQDIAKEEKQHGEIVRNLISLVGEG